MTKENKPTVAETLAQAKQYIQDVDAILITAGAGMGVDSGLPDFRGEKGFWKAYPLFKKLRFKFHDVASPYLFFDNPNLAWAFYGHRLNLYRNTEPHKGYEMLLDLVKAKGDNYFVYTTNVDGHFEKACFDTQKIYEVHGSIHKLQCNEPCQNDIWANDEQVELDLKEMRAVNLPKCKNCGGLARPNILMFDDAHWLEYKAKEQNAKFQKWKDKVFKKNQKLAIIEIGAGLAVQTIRFNNNRLVHLNEANSKIIRINPKQSKTTRPMGWGLQMGAVEALELLL